VDSGGVGGKCRQNNPFFRHQKAWGLDISSQLEARMDVSVQNGLARQSIVSMNDSPPSQLNSIRKKRQLCLIKFNAAIMVAWNDSDQFQPGIRKPILKLFIQFRLCLLFEKVAGY